MKEIREMLTSNFHTIIFFLFNIFFSIYIRVCDVENPFLYGLKAPTYEYRRHDSDFLTPPLPYVYDHGKKIKRYPLDKVGSTNSLNYVTWDLKHKPLTRINK